MWQPARSEDGKVRLWDVTTGKALGKPFAGHENWVHPSGSSDNTIWLWGVSLESWQTRACRIANRNLTLEEWRQYMEDAPYCRTCPDLPPGEGAEAPSEKTMDSDPEL